MKHGRPQCKDIPEQPIMEFLRTLGRPAFTQSGYPNSITLAFPPHCQDDTLVRAKLRRMIARGLIDGCACGCRGDYTIK